MIKQIQQKKVIITFKIIANPSKVFVDIDKLILKFKFTWEGTSPTIAKPDRGY